MNVNWEDVTTGVIVTGIVGVGGSSTGLARYVWSAIRGKRSVSANTINLQSLGVLRLVEQEPEFEPGLIRMSAPEARRPIPAMAIAIMKLFATRGVTRLSAADITYELRITDIKLQEALQTLIEDQMVMLRSGSYVQMRAPMLHLTTFGLRFIIERGWVAD